MDRWFFEDRDGPDDLVSPPIRPTASSLSISTNPSSVSSASASSAAGIARKPSSSLRTPIAPTPSLNLNVMRKWGSAGIQENQEVLEKALDPQIQAALRDTELGWPDLYDDPVEYNPVPYVLMIVDKNKIAPKSKDLDALKAQCSELDKAVEKMVDEYHSGFNNSINTFSGIVKKISDSRSKVKELKRDLLLTQELLKKIQSRRRELGAIWLKSLEYKEMIKLMDQIEDLKKTPQLLTGYMASKHYLHAVELVVSSTKTLDSQGLKEVGALRDLRKNIFQVKNSIHEVLIEELQNHLYLKSPFIKLEDLEEEEEYSYFAPSAFGSVPKKPGTTSSKDFRKKSQPQPKMPPSTKDKEKEAAKGPVTILTATAQESLDGNPELDSLSFMAILLACFDLLDKTPLAIKAIKRNIKIEFFQVFDKTISEIEQHMEDKKRERDLETSVIGGGVMKLGQTDSRVVFKELLTNLFRKLKLIIKHFQFVLEALSAKYKQRAVDIYSEMGLPTISEIWTAIQAELKIMLYGYLGDSMPSGLKAVSSRERFKLFSFAETEAAKNMNTYYKEARKKAQQGENSNFDARTMFLGSDIVDDHYTGVERTGTHRVLIKPDSYNVLHFFRPTYNFISDIQDIIYAGKHIKPDQMASELKDFLNNYVLDTLIPMIKEKMFQYLQEFVSGPEAFKLERHPRLMSGGDKPILKSALMAAKVTKELCDVLSSIPIYQEKYISMIEILLSEYHETCFSKYNEIISQPLGEDVAVEDNNAMVSSRWVNLEEIREIYDQIMRDKLKDPDAIIELESIEKEAHILLQLKSQQAVSRPDIVLDTKRLHLLANLHYSLDWLVEEILKIKVEGLSERDFTASQASDMSSALFLGSHFEGVVSQFKELSTRAIHVLRLEVRSHCLYFLDQAFKQGDYNPDSEAVEPDSSVVSLNKDLLFLDEVMAENLPPSRMRFIFDGLSLFIMRALCHNARLLRRINRNGVVKMSRNIFALQQNLAQIISSHDNFLDVARHFYNLMNYETESLVMQVQEIGHMITWEECELILDVAFRNAEQLGHGQFVFSSGPGMVNSRKVFEEELQSIKQKVSFKKAPVSMDKERV